MFNRLVEGLVKAGYKSDNLNYYRVREKNKITRGDIWNLVVGKTMTGYFYGHQWSIKIFTNGDIKVTIPGRDVRKGKAWIEGDELCIRTETHDEGLQDCGDIYRNPEGNKEALSEYLRLANYGLFPFSIEE